MTGRRALFKDKRITLSSIVYPVVSADGFLVLCVCGVVQLLAAIFLLEPFSLYPDSPGYYNFDKDIFHGQVDPARTPLYPYFIRLLKLVAGSHLFLAVVVVQKIVSFIGIYFFFVLARRLFRTAKVAWLAAIVYGCSPFIFNWDHCILTESLSITGGVCFLAMIDAAIRKPGWLWASSVNLLVFLLVMLRPSFTYLYGVLLAFWILCGWLPGTTKIYKRWIPSFALSILLVAGYCWQNKRMNGNFELSYVPILNQLKNVYDSGAYIAGSDQEIIDALDQLDQSGAAYPLKVVSQFPRSRIVSFAMSSIKNDPVKYFKYTGEKFRTIWGSSIGTVYAYHKTRLAYAIFFVYGFLFPMSLVPLLLLVDLLISAHLFLRRDARAVFKVGCFLVIVGQVLTAAIGAQSEWLRLCAPALPAIFITLFYFVDLVNDTLGKVRVLDYFEK